MSIFIFTIYLFIAIGLIIKLPFFKKSKLPPIGLACLFLLKIVAGIVYGYIHAHPPAHIGVTDTWKFFNESLPETNLLKYHPKIFFQDILFNSSTGLHPFSTQHNYWNNIKFTLMVKLAAIFNLFSLGNYYVNLIFYNFLCFFGVVLFYRQLRDKFIATEWALCIAFLIPSVLFWGSGFHKEGLILSALYIVIYHVEKITQKLHIKSMVLVAVFIIILLFLRLYVLVAVLPAIISWIWSIKYPQFSSRIFIGIHVFCLIFFFSSTILGKSFDLPEYVASRQSDFIQLQGKTMLAVPILKPTVFGFIHNLPSAIDITLLHPYPGEGGKTYIPFTVETIIFLVLLVFGSCTIVIKKQKMPLFSIFCVHFSLLLLLIIGYTVPNVGAVIRYKSIALPFLLAAFAPILQMYSISKKNTLSFFTFIKSFTSKHDLQNNDH